MSKNVFFVSDLHLNHKKIFTGRGYSSIEEHDEDIVKRWNSVVSDKDTVWVLGDVLLNPTNPEILLELKGNKKLILGNHDTPAKIERHYRPVFSRISAYEKFGGDCLLSHIPVHTSQVEERFKVNIHGHVHENTLDDPRYYNVCLEAINYTPKHYEEIKKELTERGVI